MTTQPLRRRVIAEAVGTGTLVAAVVGSGIAARRLSPDDVGLQLLENAVATGAILTALILALGQISAAFNPIVSLVQHPGSGQPGSHLVILMTAQVGGGAAGAIAANTMFDLAPIAVATTVRAGPGLWLAEVVATAGLVLVIAGTVRSGRVELVAVAVGAYITGAYWFTSSTSFANPAVTIARTLSDTFAGICPASVPGFVISQCVGGLLGYLLSRTLFPPVTAADPSGDSADLTRLRGRSGPGGARGSVVRAGSPRPRGRAPWR